MKEKNTVWIYRLSCYARADTRVASGVAYVTKGVYLFSLA